MSKNKKTANKKVEILADYAINLLEKNRKTMTAQRSPPRFENSHYTQFPCARFIENILTKELDMDVAYSEDDPVPTGFIDIRYSKTFDINYNETREESFNKVLKRIQDKRLQNEQEWTSAWIENNEYLISLNMDIYTRNRGEIRGIHAILGQALVNGIRSQF